MVNGDFFLLGREAMETLRKDLNKARDERPRSEVVACRDELSRREMKRGSEC